MDRRFLIATLVAGIAAAAIEMIFVLPIQASFGNSPAIVFQSIASGTMGKNAYIGGTPAVQLGIFYHLLISVVAAGAYIAAAKVLPFLYSRPLLGGLLCAIVAYVMMNWIVIPLSAVGYKPTTNPGMMALSFSIHVIGFGWPIAYIARMMRRGDWATAA